MQYKEQLQGGGEEERGFGYVLCNICTVFFFFSFLTRYDYLESGTLGWLNATEDRK